MKKDTCFFIGHRDAPDSVYVPLLAAVERHITEYGVRSFVVGHYGRFDALAARAVLDAKQRHPGVTLSLLLPYHPAERPVGLPDGFDGSIYPAGLERVPHRFAIVGANRRMAGTCGFLIAYAWQPGSNARRLADYARARQVRVTLLQEPQ
ncbi:MAG: hypothetical protein ACI4PD_08650 [Butyricicoccus sp.]